MKYKQEKMAIPLLDLNKFIFSPPGPMGWALSEYEQTMNEPQDIVLNELSVVKNLAVVNEEELVELPTIGLLDLKGVDNNQEPEVSLELKKPRIKTKFIVPNQPVAPRLTAGAEIFKKKKK